MEIEYTKGDLVVVRLHSTGAERMGKVTGVQGNGWAVVELYPTKLYRRPSTIKMKPNGDSSMGQFSIIKHVPHAEFIATGGVNARSEEAKVSGN